MKKVLSIFLIVVMLVACSVNPVFANNNTTSGASGGSEASDIVTSLDGKVDIGAAQNDKILEIAGKIIGAIQFISVIAAVVLVAVFGFQFILGSAEQKSDYQKKFIPLIIGVVVVFSVTTIAKILFDTLGV